LRELAQDAGHGLYFSVVSKERMIAASIAANEHGDPTMMRRHFNEISDASRAAALRQAIEFFEQQGFPRNDRYLAPTEPGHRVALTMVGTAGGHFMGRTRSQRFMGRTRSQILIGNKSDLPDPHPQWGKTFTIISLWSGTPDSRSRSQTAPAAGSRCPRAGLMREGP
jgi:hypothetical protein